MRAIAGLLVSVSLFGCCVHEPNPSVTVLSGYAFTDQEEIANPYDYPMLAYVNGKLVGAIDAKQTKSFPVNAGRAFNLTITRFPVKRAGE